MYLGSGAAYKIITQPTIKRVIGSFWMSYAYFAVATDSQFDLVFKACDGATVKTVELSPRHVLSVRNVNNAV